MLMMMEHMEQEHGTKASEVRYLLGDVTGGPRQVPDPLAPIERETSRPSPVTMLRS